MKINALSKPNGNDASVFPLALQLQSRYCFTLIMTLFSCLFFPHIACAGLSIVVPSNGIQTIGSAMIAAKAGDTVLVSDGMYTEKVSVKVGVTLKAKTLFGAILDGGGKGTVVTLSGDATLIGFEIRNGTFGIMSSNMGNTIVKCRIVRNWQSGLSCIGQMPKIEDNLFVFNKGSGIIGWNLTSSDLSIANNTIAYNSNHGISLGGTSKITIEKNIIAFNVQSAVKIAEPASITLVNNDFFQNGNTPPEAANNNLTLDPSFSNPKSKYDFSLMPDSPLKANNSRELGARLIY